MSFIIRPNTGVPDALLCGKIILCCGEDRKELLSALSSLSGVIPGETFEYRCYHFWRFEDFTLVWTGIGTGCLEPLLYEILHTDIVRLIVLIGTAGLVGHAANDLGNRAFLIDKAYLGGCAVRLADQQMPLRPRIFERKHRALMGLHRASIVSTDYYYGFGEGGGEKASLLRAKDLLLADDIKRWYNSVDLVDMECAQFYHFCTTLGDETLEYAAIKGPANQIGNVSQQTLFSRDVIYECLRIAFQLLK